MYSFLDAEPVRLSIIFLQTCEHKEWNNNLQVKLMQFAVLLTFIHTRTTIDYACIRMCSTIQIDIKAGVFYLCVCLKCKTTSPGLSCQCGPDFYNCIRLILATIVKFLCNISTKRLNSKAAYMNKRVNGSDKHFYQQCWIYCSGTSCTKKDYQNQHWD